MKEEGPVFPSLNSIQSSSSLSHSAGDTATALVNKFQRVGQQTVDATEVMTNSLHKQFDDGAVVTVNLAKRVEALVEETKRLHDTLIASQSTSRLIFDLLSAREASMM